MLFGGNIVTSGILFSHMRDHQGCPWQAPSHRREDAVPEAGLGPGQKAFIINVGLVLSPGLKSGWI